MLTNLRRGSILYHFKSKQELFEAVVETMLLNWSAALEVPLPLSKVVQAERNRKFIFRLPGRILYSSNIVLFL